MQGLDKSTRNIVRFEWLSQNVWPSVRRFFKGLIAPRCQRCVISAKVPGVILTDRICNKCLTADNLPINHEEKAWEEKYQQYQAERCHEILSSYQGAGKGDFDAFVPFSGGKDSTYMLYRLKRDYPGLRLLAATWDNGFYSSLALENARVVARKLDLDHFTYKPRASVYKSLYRYTLMHVHEGGSYGTVDRFDGSLNQHLGLRFAAELKIPLMISGVDWAQALLMGSNTSFEHPREDLLTRVDTDRIERRSRLSLSDIFDQRDRDLFWDGLKWPTERIPRWILPMIAWRPDKKEIVGELSSQNLITLAHTSPILTNNQVLSVMTAIDIKKIGYCSFEPEFADMIRYKKNDATYWRNIFEFVEFLVKKNLFFNSNISDILCRLDLSRNDVGL